MCTQSDPAWHQHGPNIAPRCLQEICNKSKILVFRNCGPKNDTPCGPMRPQHSCWGHVGWATAPDNKNLIVQTSWSHLGVTLGPYWNHCGQPCDHYTGQLGPWWGHMGCISETIIPNTKNILLSRLPEAILELCWGHIGIILGHLGTIIWVI
jgi:hypothetical protein